MNPQDFQNKFGYSQFDPFQDENIFKHLANTRYRLRVGKDSFLTPHYVTSIEPVRFTAITVNKNPLNWKNKVSAQRNLEKVKESLSTAEIEAY